MHVCCSMSATKHAFQPIDLVWSLFLFFPRKEKKKSEMKIPHDNSSYISGLGRKHHPLVRCVYYKHVNQGCGLATVKKANHYKNALFRLM